MNSISIKLFLALFGLTTVVLLASIGLARWSFSYGFNDYLDSLESERLSNIAEELVQHYDDNGGRWNDDTPALFDFIVVPTNYKPTQPPPRPRDEGLWALQNQSLDEELALLNEPDEVPRPPIFQAPPPPEFGMGMGMGPPSLYRPEESPERSDIALLGASAMAMELAGNVPGGGPRPPPPPTRPTVLLDADGQQIASTRLAIGSAAYIAHEIRVAGKLIGQLRTIAEPEFKNQTEDTFSAQQKLASVIIISLSLILAAIASWFLSRMMLAPIVTVKNGITQLASGDYIYRLPVDRKDELGMLMTDVNKLGSSLQKNRVSRRNFIADISHELRTPVTILSGEIEALKDGMRELNMGSIESLDHEVDRVKHLIDDLYQLSLSDIGGLRYEFAEMDVADLLKTIVEKSQTRIDKAGLTLDLQVNQSGMINADEQRLMQLFTNLINNSIAYTDSPGVIRITLEQQESQVFVCFEDSAPGFDVDDMSILFEPLFRAEESRNRRAGGAGLGLTICRNIASAHEASIEAKQSELGGVAITMLFPVVSK